MIRPGSGGAVMPVKRIRPRALPGVTYRMPTACGKIYVTITKNGRGRPFEVFVRFGKAGHCGAAIFDGMAKLISYALRSGMDPAEEVKALSGIVCTQGRLTSSPRPLTRCWMPLTGIIAVRTTPFPRHR